VALRLIQVGMGGWGRDWYAQIVRPNPDVALVACVDSSPEVLALAQQRLEVPAACCYASIDAALAAHEADAVLITAALPGHVPVALTALNAGMHVLCEKPFAPTLAEARQVVALAEARGRVLMVSQNYRFYPAARTAAALVREGVLGAVDTVHVDFRRYANRAPRAAHPHYRLSHPLLVDMSIHHFDLMRMVLGQEPRQVSCHAWNPPWSKFAEPAAAVATIQFDGGTLVSYRGSWVSPGPKTLWDGEWRMECERGEIFWTGRDDQGAKGDRVAVRLLGKPARRVELPELPAIDQAGSLAAFAQAIATGQEPESSGRANLGSLALTMAMIESANTGLPMPVPSV